MPNYTQLKLIDTYLNHISPLIGRANNKANVLGTAFNIAPSLALTAFHLIEEQAKWEGTGMEKATGGSKLSGEFFLLKVNKETTDSNEVFLAKGEFEELYVNKAIGISYTDEIALLMLFGINNLPHYPVLDFRPPKVGEELFTIGFPDSLIEYIEEESGFRHSLGVNPTLSSGYVIDTFPEQHSEKWHPYPGVYANFRSQGGMSGSPVFSKKTGNVIGILSSSLNTPDENGDYQSFVSTLAPLLRVERIELKNGNVYSMTNYLKLGGFKPENMSDYTFDPDSGRPIYHGPKRT